jgi:hypothetical protein
MRSSTDLEKRSKYKDDQNKITMSQMSISLTPQSSLTQVVECYIKQFQNKVERYSSQEIPHLLQKFELEKTVNILEGPYDRKTVFNNINSFNLQTGVIIIQAHKTPQNILLSVSIKISDELYAGLDSELCPPGLSYIKSALSSQCLTGNWRKEGG